MAEHVEKKMGWEVAREVEATKSTIGERAKVSGEQLRSFIKYIAVFGVLFIIACWLAGNPFEFTQRIPSEYVKKAGLVGTDSWTIVWWVVLMCAFFEYMDSAGGMGYGTALSPLLMVAGFDPTQVVPLIMITETFTGLVAGFIHGEFENVEWKWSPMNETTKLVVVVAITGMLASAISVTAIYKVMQLHKFWVKFYVAILLIVMAVCSVMTAKTYLKYRPGLMWIFAAVGGFNKGVGGGGYGPVITVGGLLSGVPVKSMVAVTSYAEGFTSLAAVITWFVLLSTGTVIDYLLLPSFVIGTVIAAVGAPYTTRVLPEKFWRWVVPVYCCFLAAYTFYKIWPDVQKRLLS
ncbi:MAG: sulfite exporter TauE/SafE family protein [Desulfobacterales bacterium]|nr:sulfite exporter TauE/SafE family protein [Desulfobacterales bacterium]